jgi:hypothetical protein
VLVEIAHTIPEQVEVSGASSAFEADEDLAQLVGQPPTVGGDASMPSASARARAPNTRLSR